MAERSQEKPGDSQEAFSAAGLAGSAAALGFGGG